MQIINDYNNCPPNAQNSAIALGNFDGIHKGHQAVIEQTIAIAKQHNIPSAVMTFEPHPISVFKPDSANFRLTSSKQKSDLIAELGIDYLFAIQFDIDFAKIKAENFITDILKDRLAVSQIVIGYDFIFGHQKGGNAEMLREYANKCDYGFTQVQAVGGDAAYSSTQIRHFLQQGKLAEAVAMLGRNYSVTGKVVHGDNRGKDIGFPTINIDSGNLLRPAGGVYAVKVCINNDAKQYNAVANIGTKPTFNGSSEELEVHIFNFDQDIYGADVAVEFVEYIRAEKKFAGVEALVAQIKDDCKVAQESLDAKC